MSGKGDNKRFNYIERIGLFYRKKRVYKEEGRLMFVYYVNNSIHQIPSFIYIARVLGGIVLTNGRDSIKVLQQEYSDITAEYHPNRAALQRRLSELRPEAIIQPDYTKEFLNVDFDTAHIQVFHGTSDKTYNYSSQVRKYDFLLLPGVRTYKTMLAAGLLTEGKYAIVGYPKADRVFKGEFNRDLAVKSLGLDPAWPTVLYAPTWQDAKFNTSLPRYGREVLSQVPEEYNLIVKLHPNTKRYDLKNYRMVKRISENNPQIKLLDFHHDVMPIMAASDLLITDISTVSHEFLCFDRPLVFLDPRLLSIRKDKVWVWRCGSVVKRKGEVWPTVKRALAAPEVYAEKRKAMREEIFYKPDGHAAERAAEAIRDFIKRRKKGQI